jgi:hypothetical protein
MGKNPIIEINSKYLVLFVVERWSDTNKFGLNELLEWSVRSDQKRLDALLLLLGAVFRRYIVVTL